MKVFFLDLWQDLREKRLWPVALVLLLGLAAVPVLLASRPRTRARSPAVSAAPPAAKDKEESAQLAQVKLDDGEDAASGSTLGVFDPSNPFRPPAKIVKAGEESSSTQAGPSGQTAPDGGADSGSAADDGGSTSGGGGPDTTPPGSGGGETTPPDSGGGTTTTVYKYVVDVTFTANGRTRKVKALDKLDMLPSQASPLLIAMGVTADGGNAVFLVDLDARGGWRGQAQAERQGVRVRVHRPGLGARLHAGRRRQLHRARRRDPKGRGQAGRRAPAPRPARRMAPARMRPSAAGTASHLFIADLVVVASDELEDSNRDDDRR